MNPKKRISFGVFIFAVCAMVAFEAQATSQCYQWTLQTNGGGWSSNANGAVDAQVAWCNATESNADHCQGGTGVCTSAAWACEFTVHQYPIVGNFPAYQQGPLIHVREYWRNDGSTFTEFNQSNALSWRANPEGCQVYVSALFQPLAQCGQACNAVGHPINPASGAVYDSAPDFNRVHTSMFQRFYNSTDISAVNISTGWRHTFTRNVKPKYAGSQYQSYGSGSDNSSLYNDEALACTSGFAEVKGRVSTWTNASASYSNGACVLSIGATQIGTLPILYTSPPTPNPASLVLIGFEARRDYGQLVTFTVNGSAISAPPGISMRLQQTSTGYTLIDTNDNVELYDSNGRLLSVTTRAGVVQTMNYDSAGHLTAISDNFGHSITPNYDAQGRLLSVTRE